MISIIIPIYRMEDYLERCVDSVLAQTYRQIEVILINDGSTDRCGQICDVYATKDSRIKVIHKENGGLSDARNCGINFATGEYLGFVDADDYIHPQMYEILLDNLQKTNSSFSVCKYSWIDEGEVPDQPGENNCREFVGEDLWRQLYVNNTETVIACNKLYKKELFQNNRFEYGRLHEDEFIVHKILFDAKKAVYSSSKLYIYIKHKESIVNNKKNKNIIDTLEAFKERRLFFKDKSKFMYINTILVEIDLLRNHFLRLKSPKYTMRMCILIVKKYLNGVLNYVET